LITRLQPYGLTKGEVLILVNLGVGLPASGAATEAADGEGEGAVEGAGEGMDVDGSAENGGGEEGAEGEEEGEAGDYGALALVDTVIEEREQRLSDEDVSAILAIIRETLGSATT
jgi:hypothetical protein